ncbi:hypothetical protein D3C86_2015940 [compost metagenome]
MTQSQCASAGVDLVLRQMKLLQRGQYLGGKCLIKFNDIQVVYIQPLAAKQFLNRRNRPNPRIAGVNSGSLRVNKPEDGG